MTSPPSVRSPGHGDRLPGLAAADRHPRSDRVRASALIPEPAMPMMCTRPRSASAGIRSLQDHLAGWFGLVET
jgi:hypothetical protein